MNRTSTRRAQQTRRVPFLHVHAAAWSEAAPSHGLAFDGVLIFTTGRKAGSAQAELIHNGKRLVCHYGPDGIAIGGLYALSADTLARTLRAAAEAIEAIERVESAP